MKDFTTRLRRDLRALQATDLTATSKLRYIIAALEALLGAGGSGDTYCLKTRRGECLFLRYRTSDVKVYREIFLYGVYSRLAAVFKRLTEHSDSPRVLDLGANIGLAAAAFKAMCPSARILCVEPEEGNFEMLRRNLELLPGAPCQALRAFVGAEPGTGYVHSAGLEEWAFQLSRAPLENAQTVPILDVNSLLNHAGWDRAELMKCDIEGAEQELFAACHSWRSRVDHIILELHGPSYGPEEVARDWKRSGAPCRITPVDNKLNVTALWLLE